MDYLTKFKARIKRKQESRLNIAKEVKRTRNGLGWGKRGNHIARYWIVDAPQKPSVKYFRKKALRNARKAKVKTWHNPLDSEYYSACGFDDMMCAIIDDAQESRLELALDYLIAKRLLK